MNLQLEFSANKNCEDVFLEIYCDNKKLIKSSAQYATQTISLDIDEVQADHVLTLVMSGKNASHTKIDDQEQMVDDVYFLIQKLEFEQLDMKEIFCLGYPCYTHSFNSADPVFVDEFYGQLGCNGTVELCFSTPIFLWLDQYLT
jgi:hypothetical protein